MCREKKSSRSLVSPLEPKRHAKIYLILLILKYLLAFTTATRLILSLKISNLHLQIKTELIKLTNLRQATTYSKELSLELVQFKISSVFFQMKPWKQICIFNSIKKCREHCLCVFKVA